MPHVDKNQENADKCKCPACPSYNNCAKEKSETLYCAEEIGKSECQYQMNGCLCGSCPVHQGNSLKNGYYCLHGSAAEIG